MSERPRKRIYLDDDVAMDQRSDGLPGSGDFADREDSWMLTMVKLISSAASGAVFGLAVEKGRVFEPGVIQDQMLFRRFIMLKMFLSAAATSMFTMSVLSMIPGTSQKFTTAAQNFSGCLRGKGYMSVMLGASVLGVGMTVAGSCPGMVLAQVGAGAGNSVYTFTGALCAAFVYGLIEPQIAKLTQPSKPIQRQYLYQDMSTPYYMLGMPFAATLGMIVLGVELLFPWRSELEGSVGNAGSGIFQEMSWPPYIAGMLIGALQVPTILLLKDTLGGSSSYCTVVSQTLVTQPLKRLSPYLVKFQNGVGNWWQVLYVTGAIAGAYASSSASASFGSIPGVTSLSAFAGGFLLIFGARLGAGCTSGHGLSGMGLLNNLSISATAAMFAGGMGMGLVMRTLGLL